MTEIHPIRTFHRDLCPAKVPSVFSVPLLFAQRVRVKIRTVKESKLRPPTLGGNETTDCVCAPCSHFVMMCQMRGGPAERYCHMK